MRLTSPRLANRPRLQLGLTSKKVEDQAADRHQCGPDEREMTMAELPEEKIYKALDQLMSACGLSGKRRTEELFSVLSEAMRAVEQQGQTLEGERDVNAWLANQIARIILRKKMEK